MVSFCSLSFRERCQVNFGATPFAFPVAGCQPLQAPPGPSRMKRAEYIVGCLERLAPRLPPVPGCSTLSFEGCVCDPLSVDDAVLVVATLASFMEPVVQCPYIVGQYILPLFLQLLRRGGTSLVHRTLQFLTVGLPDALVRLRLPFCHKQVLPILISGTAVFSRWFL